MSTHDVQESAPWSSNEFHNILNRFICQKWLERDEVRIWACIAAYALLITTQKPVCVYFSMYFKHVYEYYT